MKPELGEMIKTMTEDGRQRWLARLSDDGKIYIEVTEVLGGYATIYSGRVIGMRSTLRDAIKLCMDELDNLMAISVVAERRAFRSLVIAMGFVAIFVAVAFGIAMTCNWLLSNGGAS